MGEIVVAAVGWFAAFAIALAGLVLGHDTVAAVALAAAAITSLVARRLGSSSVLLDGIEAVGVAAVGVTLAATAHTTAIIGASAAIAFAAIVQQYAALVYAHIARRREALVGAPIGFIAMGGLVGFLLLGRPVLPLIALACWAMVDATWSAIVRGLAIASADVVLVRPPVLPPLYGRARWRRLGDGLVASRDPAFWGLVVARPLARVLLQLVVELRFITPNRVTVLSIACCFGAAALIAAGGSVPLALVLIGIRSVLDSMDGQLARYRACGSNLGSYLDKVSDLFAWGSLFGALGIRAFTATSSTAMLVLPLVAAIVLALCGFALWLARSLAPSSSPPAPPVQLGFTAWAKSLWRIVLFEEPDFYVWIALAIATARYDVFVPFIAGAHVARALVVAIARAGSRFWIGKESPA